MKRKPTQGGSAAKKNPTRTPRPSGEAELSAAEKEMVETLVAHPHKRRGPASRKSKPGKPAKRK
jgi:hypothetical protein